MFVALLLYVFQGTGVIVAQPAIVNTLAVAAVLETSSSYVSGRSSAKKERKANFYND